MADIRIEAEAKADDGGFVKAYGMSGTINTTGADLLKIDIKAIAETEGGPHPMASAWGMSGTIDTTGAGATDTDITISAIASGGSYETSEVRGMLGSIKTGAGEDSIMIDAGIFAESEANAIGMGGTITKGGDGDVAIDITARGGSAGAANAYLTGMRGTIEKKGEGKATIDIKAIAESEGDNYIIGMEKGTINLIGAGAADISIEASFSKTAGEVTGMQGGTITKEGAGVDTIDIKAIADCEYIHCGTIAHGMVEGASITMIGNDETTINIEAKGIGGNSDYCEAIGMQGSSITIIGDGGSTIGVTADINGKAAIGMQNSNITTGGGNDFIHIIGALDNSGIDTGGGNDEVWIENDIIGGSIDLGTGDDFLMLRGILSDGVDLQGGGNEEVVQALADGGMAHLGDILGLTSNNLDNLDVGSTTTIHGFEALLIELASDNQASLDDLLHGFDNLSIKQGIGYTGGHENDDNLLVSLVLTGNSDILDNLVRDNGTLLENAKQHSAVQIEGRPESDLYDHYVISYHDPVTNNDYNDINLYILKHA